MKDGLSEVAWDKLTERQKAERNIKVLQAFNLAQVWPWAAYVKCVWLTHSRGSGLSVYISVATDTKLPCVVSANAFVNNAITPYTKRK
jgi:hypothetical protein